MGKQPLFFHAFRLGILLFVSISGEGDGVHEFATSNPSNFIKYLKCWIFPTLVLNEMALEGVSWNISMD